MAVLVVLLALTAGGADAAIGTPTQLGANNAASGATTLVLTTAADSAAGNLIVVFTGSSGGAATNSITDSAGNSYVAGLSVSGGARFRPFHAINAKALPSGGTITVTFSSTSATKYVGAVSVSGVSAIDQEGAGATATSTAPTITSTALKSSSEIVFGMLEVSSGAADSFTEASGWTSNMAITNGSALRWAYKIVSSNSAVTYAPTLGTSRQWAVNVKAFQPQACGSMPLLGVGC